MDERDKKAMNKDAQSDSPFATTMLEKRNSFVELIHAAFVLDTSVSFYLSRPMPTEKELEWLTDAYPNSIVKRGNDQGAQHCTITPAL